MENFAAQPKSWSERDDDGYDCLSDAKGLSLQRCDNACAFFVCPDLELENEMPGFPCEIAEINEQGELILNEKNFKQIVKAVGNAEIAVISIVGAFRRGKSFLLNVFLRYLCYSVKSSAVYRDDSTRTYFCRDTISWIMNG